MVKYIVQTFSNKLKREQSSQTRQAANKDEDKKVIEKYKEKKASGKTGLVSISLKTPERSQRKSVHNFLPNASRREELLSQK